MISIHLIFWYNPVSLKKDRTSSILTFSNISIKLFSLNNWSLMRAKALHSIKMCLTFQGVSHVKHCGCSFFSMKEWVSLVWPMCNQDILSCTLLDFQVWLEKLGLTTLLERIMRDNLLETFKVINRSCLNFWDVALWCLSLRFVQQDT